MTNTMSTMRIRQNTMNSIGDNYTLQDIFPEQLLINDQKNQRLENADIEISLTKSTNRD